MCQEIGDWGHHSEDGMKKSPVRETDVNSQHDK